MEVDRQVSWQLKGRTYIKRTTLVEHIFVDDVPSCLQCGEPIFAARSGQRFCTPRCQRRGSKTSTSVEGGETSLKPWSK